MKKLRWQLLIIFLTGLVVGILLLSEQSSGKPLISAQQPTKGGIYTEALIGSFQRLNPILDFYNAADHDVDRLIYSGLIRFDDRGLAQADLAESWGISQDGKTYNFALRKNLVWQDGKPLTSEDVLYTVDMLRNGVNVVPADVQTFWKAVDVQALSADLVQFKLPEAFSPFLDYLTFGILPKHALAGLSFDIMLNSPFNMQPVGSGPYQFNKLIVEDGQIVGVELKAFDKYYGKKPFVEQIVFRYYADGAAALKAYQDGKVQGISNVSSDVLAGVLAEPNLAVFTGRKPELAMLLFNLKDEKTKFLQDVNFRKALMVGLNREWLVDRVLNGQAVIANGPILPGTWAYYNGLKPVAFDALAAANMLKDAGYVIPADGGSVRVKGDVQLKFTLLTPDDETHRALAESIQSDWAKLNVIVDLEAVPYEELVNQRLDQHNFQVALVDLNLASSPDPDPYPFWDQAQATGGQNYTGWDNRIASEFLEQARTTADIAQRLKFYRNFQVIWNEELPAIPLYYPVYTFAMDKELQGIRIGPLFNPSDRFANVNEWFFVVRQPLQAGATAQPTIVK